MLSIAFKCAENQSFADRAELRPRAHIELESNILNALNECLEEKLEQAQSKACQVSC